MLHSVNRETVSTIMVGYLFGIADELESKGIDACDVLKSAGVFNELSNNPLNRFSSFLLPEVLRLGAEATGDRCFGLNSMRFIRPPNLHVLGLGLLASGTMLSFCRRLARFMPIIGGTGKLVLEARPDSYRLATHAFGPMSVHAQDSWLSFIFDLMRQVSSPQLRLMGVELMHSRPTGDTDLYERRFQAPVAFGCRQCALELSKESVTQPLRAGSEELASAQDLSAMSYLVRLNGGDIIGQVQLAIVSCLQETDSVSLEFVTAHTGLSSRQIQQRLAECQTNYQTVLDQTRLYLAKMKLREPKLQVSEVAYMVGFTDSANFSRAFKRWTGESPIGYRNRVQSRKH